MKMAKESEWGYFSINPQENWLLPLLVEGEMTFPSMGSHQVEKRVTD